MGAQGGVNMELTKDCLEKMDTLILQSSRGVHLLFDRDDIKKAIQADLKDEENSIERLKHIQSILFKFISLKDIQQKKDFLLTLGETDYSILIRAYFKIVENSMLNKKQQFH